MKYYVANFKFEGAGNAEVCRDIIASLAAEAGFESFEEKGDSLYGYVQQDLLNESLLKSLLADFPIEGVTAIGMSNGNNKALNQSLSEINA